VPNVKAHPSTAGVPITVLLYNAPLLCGFNVSIKGLTFSEETRSDRTASNAIGQSGVFCMVWSFQYTLQKTQSGTIHLRFSLNTFFYTRIIAVDTKHMTLKDGLSNLAGKLFHVADLLTASR